MTTFICNMYYFQVGTVKLTSFTLINLVEPVSLTWTNLLVIPVLIHVLHVSIDGVCPR